MIVSGVMSGTSADGIDVAIVRISGKGSKLRLQLLLHRHVAYPVRVRQAVLNAMNANSASVADLSRLNFLLGELYADAIKQTMRYGRFKIDLIGCHGQTLYHQGDDSPFLGRPIASTWQTGEGSVIATRAGIPVISDFRPADMASGGKGAPLVPLLDIAYYSHPKRLRILQNIGGIGNLTLIPPGTHLDRTNSVIAFDTGPGNMVMDACAQELLGRPFDANGATAARGTVIEPALRKTLAHPFFRRKPPKTAGREQFGPEFVTQFRRWCGPSAAAANVLATATALTSESIGKALRQATAISRIGVPVRSGDYIVSGGGTKNRTLMRMIADQVQLLGFRFLKSDELGIPSEAKEAVAFALLAYQTWNRQPGNVPRATGARRLAVLGKISYP